MKQGYSGVEGSVLLLAATRCEGAVCVFCVKSGDLYGSEGVVAQGADWHSDAG